MRAETPRSYVSEVVLLDILIFHLYQRLLNCDSRNPSQCLKHSKAKCITADSYGHDMKPSEATF